ALLRRYRNTSEEKPTRAEDEPTVLSFDGLTIDNSTQKVVLFKKEIRLTTTDFEVLWILASRAGETVTREEIFETTRGITYNGFDRSIDVRISRLRKKLDDHPTNPRRIKTIWGKGYLFVKDGWQS
ncbi:winged helix-turn-helix domain-containing protein, partial [bacterium]|nr:winged helix-turn-helix domain-containing protein [bacterium]